MLVGEEEKAFVIHRNIACDESDFFATACTGNWQEGKDKAIRLPEADVRAFTMFVGWLHTNKLDLSRNGSLPIYSAELGDEAVNDIEEDIRCCFYLGDFLSARRFCNTVVDELKTCFETTFTLPQARFTESQNFRLSSILGRLVVDYVAAEMSEEDFIKDIKHYPAAFITEVAKVSLRERMMPEEERLPKNRPKCYYHEHKDDRDKCL